MKIGLIGLPQVGKKALFSLLTGGQIVEHTSQAKIEVKIGTAKIRDKRFDELVKIYNPLKRVPAAIDIFLLPKFDKETLQSGEFLKSLESCDALCHIVRAFTDDSIFHVEGNVNAMRDIDNVFGEIILSDLILIEKRIERILKELMNKPSPLQVKEKEILMKMKTTLDKNLPLSTFVLNDDEKKMMATYQFLSKKPMIIVLNVNDDKLSDQSLVGQVAEKYKEFSVRVMQVSAKIEAELSALPEEEKDAFLKDLDIKESALNQLTRLCYETLGLISFFTVGEDEVRAWITKRHSAAPEAAGAIHSDLQRGFIRAEIMKSHELIELGSETKLKEAGKFLIKGKDYIVEDGDIMHVRFSV